MDGFVKGSNSRRVNFAFMRRTSRTLIVCKMKHNAEVGPFTEPSKVARAIPAVRTQLFLGHANGRHKVWEFLVSQRS